MGRGGRSEAEGVLVAVIGPVAVGTHLREKKPAAELCPLQLVELVAHVGAPEAEDLGDEIVLEEADGSEDLSDGRKSASLSRAIGGAAARTGGFGGAARGGRRNPLGRAGAGVRAGSSGSAGGRREA